jgi:hypothetical protein
MGKKIEGKAAAKKQAKKPETKAEAKAANEAKAAAQKAASCAEAKERMSRSLAVKDHAIDQPAPSTAGGMFSTSRERSSDPVAIENARAKKLMQSNLKGQVANAIAKLTSSDQGKITLTASGRLDLEAKVKFGQDYAQLHDQKKKDEMLESFKQDRSCKSWATYNNSYEKAETVVQTKVNGYGTR